MKLELLTRPDCHLCAAMAAVLDAVLPGEGLTYTPVDVDAHPELRARFGDVVPVLLRDGQPVAKVRIDAERLQRLIRRRRR